MTVARPCASSPITWKQRSGRSASASGLTGADVILGTPDFIAPEQTQDSRSVDIRADIYALGCTLYFLLSGKTPFRGTWKEKLDSHCQETPLRLPGVPEGLRAIMARMMAKDPAQRHQTPAAVAEALAAWAASSESTGKTDEIARTPSSAPRPTRRPTARGWATIVVGCAAALPLVWAAVQALHGPEKTLIAPNPASVPAAVPAASRTPLPVLLILPQQFKWRSYAPLRTTLEGEHGWPIKIASTAATDCVTIDRPDSPQQVRPDLVLDATVSARDFAGMIIPGGNAFQFKEDYPPRAIVWRLLAEMGAQEKCIAAIDSGMLVLTRAGTLEGKKASRHDGEKGASKVQWLDQAVVRDGRLVTAAKKEDAAAFSREVLEALKESGQ